jgi:DNA helicase-2/ATP-dependent DNA helicase PcrA
MEYMKEEIVQWLKEEQENIEDIFCDSAKTFLKARRIDNPANNFLYDLQRCGLESFNLKYGKDLCYDRYSVGLSYSMWYLGRRVNTSLSFLLDLFLNCQKEGIPMEVFDLGAGTGAVQIALGLCHEAVVQLGGKPPNIRVVNVDISPFMLDYNRTFLWKGFQKKYPSMKGIYPEFTVNSWTNPENIKLQTPIVVASYLFDHTENQKEITKHFQDILETHQPETVILSTSNQFNKKELLRRVSEEVAGKNYKVSTVKHENFLCGRMNKVASFRKKINKEYGKELFPERVPSWSEQSFFAQLLRRTQSRFSLEHFADVFNKEGLRSLDLYVPPIKLRREIILNPEQKRAAKTQVLQQLSSDLRVVEKV